MQDKTRLTMELYVEKGHALRDSRFVAFARENGFKLTLGVTQDDKPQSTLTVPDKEAVQAFVLTLRMFIQNNDRLSFANVAQILDDPGVSKQWKDQCTTVRDWLNQQLDSPAMTIGGTPLTKRDIMETFIYGHLAHSNEAKRQQYRQWETMGLPMFDFIQFYFSSTLGDVLEATAWTTAICEDELNSKPIPPIHAALTS